MLEEELRARIPVIVKDPVVSNYRNVSPTELITIDEGVFLDGPVSPRVAVLDFEPGVGSLSEPARYLAPTGSRTLGRYEIPIPLGALDAEVHVVAAAVSVFGVVHKTMIMFEEEDALGRKVDWAFDAPQLLVVPRAGEMPNAFYERESHSLQFFFFDHEGPTGKARIFTSHSQDIVAHETAHALLDGVAPDLYDAISPQALAIHEAVADLAALVVSLRCRQLTRKVLENVNGDLGNSNVFSGLAEQFGMAIHPSRNYLRNLNDDATIGGNAPVATEDPHDLSRVLSGAFYRMFLTTYDGLRQSTEGGHPDRNSLVSAPEAAYVEQVALGQQSDSQPGRNRAPSLHENEKALFVAADRLKRTLLRGLDYLPPGDVNFADLARAVVAADEASHPDSGTIRTWLIDEFVRRGVAQSAADLEVETNIEHMAIAHLDVEELIASDFAAYAFAQANTDLLRIPNSTPFEVRPRLDVTKLYWHRSGKRRVREVLLKVTWSIIEDSHTGGALPSRRRCRAGTTLAIGLDRDIPYIRALITTRREASDLTATDELLKKLVASEELNVTAIPSSLNPLSGAIVAEIGSDVLRVRGLARSLHAIGGNYA